MTTYEEEDNSPESWRAWLPDIMEQLHLGTYDSSAHSIAMAAISRVKSEADLKALVKEALGRARTLGFVGERKPEDLVPVGAMAYATDFHGQVTGEEVPKVQSTWNGRGIVRIEGKSFLKSHIEGKVFRIKNSGQASWFMEGILVTVTSCGTKNVKVRFATDPTLKHPSSFKLGQYWESQKRNSDWHLVVPYEWIVSGFQV